MISKIERDEVQPTLDIAAKLAKALGVTLSEMLHATEAKQVIFLSKDEQAVWEDAQHIRRQNVSPVFEGLKTEWLLVELPPKTPIIRSEAVIEKGGEKFFLVIKGVLQVTIKEKVYELKSGDSLYFDSACSHSCFNPGKTVTKFYVVVRHP